MKIEVFLLLPGCEAACKSIVRLTHVHVLVFISLDVGC